MCKSIFGLLTLLMFSSPAFAGYELVCKGYAPQSKHQTIYVDCTNRKAVIEILGTAWSTLRKEGIGGPTEDLCWKPYNTAKDMHPSVSFNGIAQTFFMQCNMALQYVNSK